MFFGTCMPMPEDEEMVGRYASCRPPRPNQDDDVWCHRDTRRPVDKGRTWKAMTCIGTVACDDLMAWGELNSVPGPGCSNPSGTSGPRTSRANDSGTRGIGPQ